MIIGHGCAAQVAACASRRGGGVNMAHMVFIVEDKVFAGLPKVVRDAALAETKKLLGFNRKFQVLTRAPNQFPATLDFTDAVFKLVETENDVADFMNESFRQQRKNVEHSIRQNGIRIVASPIGRFPGTPDRIGVGFMQKEVLTAGAARLAMTVTFGTASLTSVQSELVLELADGKGKDEILKDRDAAIKKKGLGGYFGKHQALIDTRRLMVHELMDKSLASWPVDEQKKLGVALARVIAHEVRHQYIQGHSSDGLGADSPRIWGDKNFEQFSASDQSDIIKALVQLETEQRRATIHLETLPQGQPFPF